MIVRRDWILGMAALLVVFLPCALRGADAGSRTISVNGEAEVKVVPDEVVFTLAVETHDLDMDRAKSENDARVKEVLAAIQKVGVAAKDIQTDFMNISPRYEDYAQRKFLGYFVFQGIIVTLRDIDRFQDLLMGILRSGAEYVRGIDFRTSELRKHRDNARALAIRAAKEKAVAMAGEIGQRVGVPRAIQEGAVDWWSSYRWWDWYGSWWRSGGMNAMSQNVVQNASSDRGGSVDGPLAPGTISVKASVSATFELE